MQLNNEIRIGLLFSLTGTTSVTERGAYQAALLAIRQVNDRGGIHGTRLVPVTEDIASDPRLSAEKAEKLIRQEQVSTIIGLYTSACRKVTIPILEKYNKLLFYPALYEGEELSPNVFYCGPVPNQQLEYFIPWILQNVGPSVYLIGSDYVYPKETHKHIRRLVKVHGGTISGEHYAALGAQKFHQVIKTIENLAPHAVFSTLVGESALIFYQQFRDANLNIPIASSITGETEIQAMGAKYAEGHYTSFPYFSSVVTEKNQQFRKLYSENYGTAAVSFVMESAYFSVWLLAEAIRKTNSIETDRIRMALQGMTFDAPQGGIRVDEDNQHIWLQSRIGRANAKGEFDIVWESDGPIPPLPFYSIESKDRQEEHTHDVASIELLRSTQEQYGLLIKIIQDISQFFSYRFAIFNPEGITLAVFSHEADEIRNLDFPPFLQSGVRISHRISGRSGFSLALVGQCEAIVKGDDHEREELKKWMTIGIPIQSKKGEFLGVLGILIQDWIASADNTSLIASFRQLTKCAVEIWENTKNRLETEGLLEGAIHLFSEGYLAIQDGCVITCNKRAESLLLEDPALLNRVIDNLKNLSGSEILFRTSTVQNSFEIKGRVENHIYHLLLNRIRTTEDKTRKQKASIKNIVGTSSIFLKNIKLAELASQMDANVLILGESGTGKELFARAIHRGSSRRDKPFIAINCAAMPRELLNSELFGYVEGAFTGARRGGSPGKFELANGGTLFLDEIGDMPIEQQAALLRVLQEKEVVRIGGSAMIPIDVRIISATNKRLTQEIAYNGSFRSDLYYRLNVFTIELTPLRNRREDIPELVAYFLQELSHTTGLPEKSIDGHAIEAFMRYSWPGNVRELRNVVERSFYLSGYAEIISLKHIPEYVAFRDEIDHHVESARSSDSISKPQEIDRISATPNDLGTQDIKSIRLMKVETEKHEIARILHQNNGNISRCAKELGMSRTTLYRKLKDYNFM